MNRQQIDGNVTKVEKEDDAVDNSMHNIAMTFTEHAMHVNETLYKKLFREYAEQYDILLTGNEKLRNDFMKVQRTKVGGGYHVWHFEDGARWAGSRILTWILYLNDVEDGGETEFLYYPRRIKPQTGRFIIWPAGFTHSHRGNPPLTNTKYIMTGWMGY